MAVVDLLVSGFPRTRHSLDDPEPPYKPLRQGLRAVPASAERSRGQSHKAHKGDAMRRPRCRPAATP